MYRNPDHLVVAAVGNHGSSGQGSMLSPATFKNGLAVGASCDVESDVLGMPGFSSLGYTSDGRIKPDIMAPGLKTFSASAGPECGASSKTGTSMATPAVSAAAALAR